MLRSKLLCGKTFVVVVNKKEDDVTFLWDEYQKVLPELLADYGITEHVKQVGQQIWAGFARRTLQMQGINVSDIDFDILKKTDPLGFLIRLTSQLCNIKTLKDLRQAIRVHDAEGNKAILLKMAKQGELRPNKHKTKMGQYLVSYTNQGDCYDSKFDKKIRRLAPEWFVNSTDENKKQLLEMAESGEPRPNGHKTKIGKCLSHYISQSGSCYDSKFDKKVRQIAPEWFNRKIQVHSES